MDKNLSYAIFQSRLAIAHIDELIDLCRDMRARGIISQKDAFIIEKDLKSGSDSLLKPLADILQDAPSSSLEDIVREHKQRLEETTRAIWGMEKD
jgi:hypothetical protein